MKRIAMGLLWSLILYFGIVGIGGALIGAMAGSGGKNVQPKNGSPRIRLPQFLRLARPEGSLLGA